MTRVLVVSADRTTSGGVPQNVGDSLLTDALVGALRAGGASVRVADPGVPGRRDRTPVAGARALARAVRSADLVVIGGGTLLQDDQPQARLLRGLPRTVAVVLATARLSGTRVASIGVGCEPIARLRPRLLLRAALQSVPVWVRDDRSAAAFRANFGRSPRVAADVILLEPPAEPAPAQPARMLVVALEPVQAAQLDEPTLASWRERFDRIVFLSMDQGDDPDFASLGIDPASFDQVVVGRPTDDFRAAVPGAAAVVASRMHALYLAALAGVPALVVGAKAKTLSFADEFGLPTTPTVRGADPSEARPADAAALDAARARVATALGEVLLGR